MHVKFDCDWRCIFIGAMALSKEAESIIALVKRSRIGVLVVGQGGQGKSPRR